MPNISVIMSTYKEPEEYIRLSVESILHQSYSDFEFIIVVDDPQNYGLIEQLSAYEKKDSRISIKYNNHNMGLPASLNIALKEAKGRLIARMDADDISDLDRFEKQITYLGDNNLDLVGCSVRRISEAGDVVSKKTNESYPPECIAKTLIYDDCIPHPTWLAKKTLFDDLNGYREIHSCEDYDFLLRALKNGAWLGICDDILMSYRINTNGISRSNSLKQHLTASYLGKNFERINDITQNEIDDYVGKKYTNIKAQRYEQAIRELNDGLDKLKNTKVNGIGNLIHALAISPSVADNLKRISKMQSIRRNYK